MRIELLTQMIKSRAKQLSPEACMEIVEWCANSDEVITAERGMAYREGEIDLKEATSLNESVHHFRSVAYHLAKLIELARD